MDMDALKPWHELTDQERAAYRATLPNLRIHRWVGAHLPADTPERQHLTTEPNRTA